MKLKQKRVGQCVAHDVLALSHGDSKFIETQIKLNTSIFVKETSMKTDIWSWTISTQNIIYYIAFYIILYSIRF